MTVTNVLAAYLITRYATDTGLSGPFGILDKFREQTKQWDVSAEIFDCPFCTAFYAGVLVLLLPAKLRAPLAAAGGVAMFYTVSNEFKDAVAWWADWVDMQTGDENEVEL